MNHASIAIGSQAELTTCLELEARLGFLKPTERESIVNARDSVGRLLYGLDRALKRKLAERRRSRSVSGPKP